MTKLSATPTAPPPSSAATVRRREKRNKRKAKTVEMRATPAKQRGVCLRSYYQYKHSHLLPLLRRVDRGRKEVGRWVRWAIGLDTASLSRQHILLERRVKKLEKALAELKSNPGRSRGSAAAAPPAAGRLPAPPALAPPPLAPPPLAPPPLAAPIPVPATSTTTFGDHPIFSKYFKMVAMGVPKGAVMQRVGKDGIADASFLERNASSPFAGAAPALPPPPPPPQSLLSSSSSSSSSSSGAMGVSGGEVGGGRPFSAADLANVRLRSRSRSSSSAKGGALGAGAMAPGTPAASGGGSSSGATGGDSAGISLAAIQQSLKKLRRVDSEIKPARCPATISGKVGPGGGDEGDFCGAINLAAIRACRSALKPTGERRRRSSLGVGGGAGGGAGSSLRRVSFSTTSNSPHAPSPLGPAGAAKRRKKKHQSEGAAVGAGSGSNMDKENGAGGAGAGAGGKKKRFSADDIFSVKLKKVRDEDGVRRSPGGTPSRTKALQQRLNRTRSERSPLTTQDFLHNALLRKFEVSSGE